MFQKVFILLSGIVILIIFAFVIFTFMVPEDSPVPGLSISDSEIVAESASTTEQQLPLSRFVDLSYGEFTFEPFGENNYSVQTEVIVPDSRPFTDKALVLTTGAGSYFGTKDSDFTGSRIMFDRESGDFVLMFEGETQSTTSIATMYRRADYENIEQDLKRIRLNGIFTSEDQSGIDSFTAAVQKYCHAVEDTSSPNKYYNLLTTSEFDALSVSEQMEYGPFLCGAGQFYIFDTFIVKAHFTYDGVRVREIKIK